MGKISLPSSPFLSRVEYHNSDFKRFNCNYPATLCKNFVNFGPVTLFKRVKGVHPLFDQQYGYAAPLLDLVGISTEFSGAITTQFCFSFSMGVSLLCRAGYTRLCHAFLVYIAKPWYQLQHFNTSAWWYVWEPNPGTAGRIWGPAVVPLGDVCVLYGYACQNAFINKCIWDWGPGRWQLVLHVPNLT